MRLSKKGLPFSEEFKKGNQFDYLYRKNFNARDDGYRPYQIRLQKRKSTGELLVSLSTGSRFMVFPLNDLDTMIMEMITLRTKIGDLIGDL